MKKIIVPVFFLICVMLSAVDIYEGGHSVNKSLLQKVFKLLDDRNFQN